MPLTLRLALALLFGAPSLLAAQDADWLAGLGHVARERRDPAVALEHFEAALALDSMHYAANWEAALALIDLGSDYPDDRRSAQRDSLYARAEAHAARAVAARPDGADGWFALANAMGRASLTLGNRDRARRAAEIRNAARRATELAPRHAGAWHVLGRWHAEVMRLSAIQRFFARNFLGGGVLGEASWDSAVAQLERAAALDPERVIHRLALAGVLADRGRYTEARGQLERIPELPDIDYGDGKHRRAAAVLLARISGRRDRRQPRYRSRAESIPSSTRSRSSRRRRRSSRRVRFETSSKDSRASSPSSRARRAIVRRVSSPLRGEKRSAIPAPITAPRITPAISPPPSRSSSCFMGTSAVRMNEWNVSGGDVGSMTGHANPSKPRCRLPRRDHFLDTQLHAYVVLAPPFRGGVHPLIF